MKTYEVRRNNACPNGLHPDYNPEVDPSLNECTCPWLVVSSNTPVQHLTSWNRRELDNLIRETDRGYFDPPNTEKRKNSMFLSPTLQRLLDVAEREPVTAALSLLAGAVAHGDSGLPPFDAIAWDAEDACLSLRTGEAGGWRRLWLGHTNVDAVTDADGRPGGANPVLLWADHPDTAAEIGLVGFYPRPGEISPDVYAEDSNEYAPEGQPTAREVFAALGITQEDQEAVLRYWPNLPLELFTPDRVRMAKERDAEGAVLAEQVEAIRAALPAAEWVKVAGPVTFGSIVDSSAPLVVTAPADQIPDLKPGHPVYDDAVRQSFLSGAGFIVVPEEMAFPQTPLADEVAGLLANLPRRTRQTPSTIAQAGSACTCAVRGSGPDTYRCPEHPADDETAAQAETAPPVTSWELPVIGEDGYEVPPLCLDTDLPRGMGYYACRRTAGHEGFHQNGSAKWGTF